MKINDIQRLGAVNSYQKNNPMKSDKNSGNKNKRDEVLISAEAKKMLDAQAIDTGSSMQNNPHIQKLKQSVSAGTYEVDAGKVAEKLLPYLK